MKTLSYLERSVVAAGEEDPVQCSAGMQGTPNKGEQRRKEEKPVNGP